MPDIAGSFARGRQSTGGGQALMDLISFIAELQLERERFQEQKRHNKAIENIGQAQQERLGDLAGLQQTLKGGFAVELGGIDAQLAELRDRYGSLSLLGGEDDTELVSLGAEIETLEDQRRDILKVMFPQEAAVLDSLREATSGKGELPEVFSEKPKTLEDILGGTQSTLGPTSLAGFPGLQGLFNLGFSAAPAASTGAPIKSPK